jgi:hypothetical protein|tara:strand:- start:361 stop:477 length:117 start_codon:yes stop_codon:yes gene_type:complete
MKNILLFSLIFIFLFGCGKKSDPEYQSIKIEKNTIANL